MLCTEGLDGEVVDEAAGIEEGGDGMLEMVAATIAVDKRNELGLYLSTQWQLRQ